MSRKKQTAPAAPIVPDNVRTVDILRAAPDGYSAAALQRLFDMPTELDKPDNVRSYPACHHSSALKADLE